MKQRLDTKANWAAKNPVLLAGELGIVSDDPNLYKVGDGTTAWNALPFRGFDGTLVHTTGNSQTAAMSQKGVTEGLAKLSEDLGKYEVLEQYYTSSTGKAVLNKGGAWSTKINVEEGEKITIIKAIGGEGIRQWIFVDDSLNVISRAEANAKASVTLITPNNATALIVQDGTGSNDIVIKLGLTIELASLKDYADSINSNLSSELASLEKEINGEKIPFPSMVWVLSPLPRVLKEGEVIASIVGADKILAEYADGSEQFYIYAADTPYTLKNDISSFAKTTNDDGYILLANGINTKILMQQENIDKAEIQLNGGTYIERVTDFKNKGKYLYVNNEINSEEVSSQYNISDYIVIEDAKNIIMTNLWSGISGLRAYVIYNHNKQIVGYNETPENTGLNNYELSSDDLPAGAYYLRATQNTSYDASIVVKRELTSLESQIKEVGKSMQDLSESASIFLPVPQLAKVNILSDSLPTTKTDDIHAVMEFNDMQGNIIKKHIIINAQGNSTLGHPKKNFSIDIVDSKYDGSHSIKFGDWVSQDSFHLKSYMLDTTRVKAMAAYNFYESILLTRGISKDRTWKRMQLPTDIPYAAESVTGDYLAMDSGAKCHPVGFPFILSHNGEFYGIYCWQLKKHRDNYHQKKDKAEHIHLDGNISKELLWNANGVIDWNKWSGITAESTGNTDGIEIRNPKSLILVDKSKYDGDDNRGELISATSPNYDANNANMFMTAKVRESIESLSSRVYALTQMANGDAKKAAIADVFDVDSIIDYIIFSQITGNIDGYAKNWQWTSYDGVKWAVNAYDLDSTFGWGGTSFYEPPKTILGKDSAPIKLVAENYLEEIKSRYAELRRLNVISASSVLKTLYDYIRVIGNDNYKQEYAKWNIGNLDNLWRFESWVEESIKRTDALMDYNS